MPPSSRHPQRAKQPEAELIGARSGGRTVLALPPLCCPDDQLTATSPTAPTPCTSAASVQGERPCARSQSFATWRARARRDFDRRTAKRRSAGSELVWLLLSLGQLVRLGGFRLRGERAPLPELRQAHSPGAARVVSLDVATVHPLCCACAELICFWAGARVGWARGRTRRERPRRSSCGCRVPALCHSTRWRVCSPYRTSRAL